MYQDCPEDGGSCAIAGFALASFPFYPLPGCATSIIGGCIVADCTGNLLVGTDSAGTITVEGTLVDGGISLVFGDGGYSFFSTTRKMWNGGETLTFAATGGTIPAFSGKTVVAPNLQWLIPVSPPCTSFACGSISRSADLSVAWTGAASSSVLLLLNSSSTAANKTTFVQCSATSSPFLISAAVLAKLGPTDAGFGNLLLMYPYNVTTFTAAGYVVSLEVASHGSGGNFTTSN